MTIKNKILSYALVALLLVIGYQQVVAWIKGVEWSPVQSIYRVKPRTVSAAPIDLRKGERLETLPCTTLEVIRPAEANLEAQVAQSFTIGRWDIPYSKHGGVAEAKVDKQTGKASLNFTAKPDGLFELGRSSYVTLWGSYVDSVTGVAMSGYEVTLEYERDMVRIGPLWTRLRVGGGREKLTGNNVVREGWLVRASVGIGVGL